ncbi:DNA-binding protein [Roseateles sp.]|uniref:DNA-binding protein n=1 Tax=Roseateles sp. TaxID=1971397 RepID=UPI0039E9988F
MARGITESDVFKACDALLLEGARPTIERVRQALGRGSPNTISPMLETWFKHLGARIKDPGAFSAPAAIPDPVLQAAQHFWEVAQADARRDVDERVRDGLAAAVANVEAEKERAAIAEAAAFSANTRANHLQAQLDELQAALESERIHHASTAAKASAASERCDALQTEVLAAQQAAAEERARADKAIALADERAAGAERRAALEIDRERVLRTKAEKATESVAKRFEAALKAEVTAMGQLTAVEDRLTQHRLESSRREEELLAVTGRLETRARALEAALSEANQLLSRSTASEVLAEQIVAKLVAVDEKRKEPAVPSRSRKKKAAA